MTTLRRSTAFALALSALLLTLAGPAGARPGGGHSYSRGHSSSSHGSSSHSSPGRSSGGSRSGSGYRPSPPSPGYRPVPIPISPSRPARSSNPASTGLGCGCMFVVFLVILAVIVLVIFLIKRSQKAGPPASAPQQPLDLDVIRNLDPDFSAVLFLDFAYALYARAHQARASQPALDALAPYLSPEVRASLADRPPAGVPVSEVVVGALRAAGIDLPSTEPVPGSPPAQVRVRLEIESNLTLGDAGSERTQYASETWTLVRGAGVRTKPPQDVRSFHCPNCGAPFTSSGSDRCDYCGEVVSGGRFDWTVVSAVLDAAEDRPPALTGTVEEVGTNWPTVFHPALAARRAGLLRDDPTATDEALAARLRLIYDDLNRAWTGLDLAPVRPYVSDGLFDYLQYWITAYQSQGLRNVLEGMRLTELALTKVVRDRWYDALTFRIWGTGRDSTIRVATGEVAGGDPKHDRTYSEYWTLIRGSGVRGAPRVDKTCPNCGAALDTNMAGECAHCGAKVTSGEFDWVLSRIEQDDSYTG